MILMDFSSAAVINKPYNRIDQPCVGKFSKNLTFDMFFNITDVI